MNTPSSQVKFVIEIEPRSHPIGVQGWVGIYLLNVGSYDYGDSSAPSSARPHCFCHLPVLRENLMRKIEGVEPDDDT